MKPCCEARLPKRFAPNAKSDGLVLMDTAARFAPAYGTPAAAAADDDGDDDDALPMEDAAPKEELRPDDADAAWLWDRGHSAVEAEWALTTSASAVTSGSGGGGGATAGLQLLFRRTLMTAAPEGSDWNTWPRSRDDEDAEEEEDQWEEEMVAVEAIFGATFVSRPSPSHVEVSVETPLGWVTLEVTRPTGKRYPESEPPLIALIGMGGGAGVGPGAYCSSTLHVT
jgi:hypothetical protein